MAAALFFKHRRLILVLPRQFGGKTELGVRLGEDLLCRPTTKSSLFLAKDKKSAKRATREKFERVYDKKLFNINTEHIYLKKHITSNMYIESVDKDPDRIRGGTMAYVHWSEVAFSKIELGETIISVFDKIIKPTLELQNGYCLLESTLNGKNGFKDIWDDYQTYGFHRMLISFGMMVDLGLVDEETYYRIRDTTHPDVFRQEYECEWVTFQGRTYPEFNEALHVDKNMPGPKPWQRVVFAIDWGYNPSATCVLFAYVYEGVLHVFDEHYQKEELAKHTAEAIQQKKVYWGIEHLGGVADHEEDRITELTLRGIPCGKANKTNVLGARMEIKEKLYFNTIKFHPRCKYALKDIDAAVWDEKKDGAIDDAQCTWGHFDAESTLRYLVRAMGDLEAEEPDEGDVACYDEMSERARQMGGPFDEN